MSAFEWVLSSLPPIDDTVRSALDAQVRHFSKLVGWANIAVAVGVAMEGVEFLHDAISGIKRWRRRKRELAVRKELVEIFPAGEVRPHESHSGHPKWVKRFTKIGLIVVVAGVVAEWRCGAKLEDAHSAVHAFDIKEIAGINEKSSENEKEAARLGRDNEQLKKDAEDEHLARVEAEEAVAWRRLTPSNRQKLRSELSPFTLNRAWFQYNSNDIEAFDFGSDLAASLPASWNPTEPTPVMSLREGPVKLGTNGPLQRGIRVAASGDKSYGKAADILERIS